MDNVISRSEKDSILYYQGGGAGIVLEPEGGYLKDFYNVCNSYIVINALLMPGISNERARLIGEKKQVALVMFKHVDELVEVYCRLYSAMCKYTYHYEHEGTYHTYRDDRMNTLEFLGHGQMYSFMSTKKCNRENKDFHGKDGILLLQVKARGDIEHLDVNAVLEGESIFPHEQEILFAPFVLLDKEPLEMTEGEKSYKDAHGAPPKAKYLLQLRLSSVVPCRPGSREEVKKELYAKIMDSYSIDTVRQIWETFMSGEEPNADAVRRYVDWKEKFQIYLRLRFAEIKYEVMGCQQGMDETGDIDGRQDADEKRGMADRRDEDEKRGMADRQDASHMPEADTVKNGSDRQIDRERLERLEEDIRNYYGYTDGKRTRYKKCVQAVNVIVSVLCPMTTFFVALSFLEELQVCMKVIGLLCSTIGVIAPLVAKGLAWNENLQQRTETYLKLDELLRDMKYERAWGEDTLRGFEGRYKAIISEDNKAGLGNATVMGMHSENVMKNSENKQGLGNGEKG